MTELHPTIRCPRPLPILGYWEATHRVAAPSMWDDAVLGADEEGTAERQLGSRYNFCLSADEICLQSPDKMHSLVVKLLCRFLGYRGPGDRAYEVHPEFEDDETGFDEEDAGWMYMSVVE
ncbi:hypothetical protein BDV10DRAFT_183550 [Aspergillus recurvatus]